MGNGLSTPEEIGIYVSNIGQAFQQYKELIINNAIDSQLLNYLTEDEFYQTLQDIGLDHHYYYQYYYYFTIIIIINIIFIIIIITIIH